MERPSTDAETDWGSVGISAAVLVVGAVVVVGVVYAALTASVTRTEYEAYADSCEELAGQTRYTETGLGREAITLNESHVRACENTTFAQFERQRVASMWQAPLNPFQVAWFGGFGLALLVGGAALLRQQLPLKWH